MDLPHREYTCEFSVFGYFCTRYNLCHSGTYKMQSIEKTEENHVLHCLFLESS